MPRPLQIHRPRHAVRRAAALTAAAASTAVLAAPPAHAGSFEQVTRASGAQGAASFTRYAFPLGVSDDGRLALFADAPPYGPATIRVRDIVTNTTRTLLELPKGTGATGIDRSQTKLLLQSDDTVAVHDLTTGKQRVIASIDAVNDWQTTAAISGDGKTVAIASPATGLTLYDAETSTVRRHVDDSSLKLNSRSLSDDGSVVAGDDDFYGFWIKGDGELQSIDGNAIVSPDGSTVVGVGPWNGGDIAVVKTADGSKQALPAPEPHDWPFPVWISPDGAKLVVAGYAGAEKPAYAVDTATGATTTFGGAFTGSIRGDIRGPGPVRAFINRNGKVALVGFSGPGSILQTQLAVANLSGADLPGAQEPVSASTYVPFDYPLAYGCETGTPADELRGSFQRPAGWLPKPLLAQVRVTIDGKHAFNRTLTKWWDRSTTPFPTEQTSIVVPYNAKTTKAFTISATTIDQRGNVATSTETVKPVCSS